METYDPDLVPPSFGLNNTGVICHINALLQGLVSNSAFVRAVLANRDYLSRTETGRAIYDFVWAAMPAAKRPPRGPPFGGDTEIDLQSAKVLAALCADLRVRRPNFRYGPSQESASEGLVLLLDMIDDPGPPADGEENPISRLFYHRYEGVVYCRGCKQAVSEEIDVAVQFNLFHYDTLRNRPRLPADFGEMIRSQVSSLEDYRCEKCGKRAGGFRCYRLRMIPEIMVCVFNLYSDRRTRVPRYFPVRVPFPGIAGGQMIFRQTAQVEQFGTLGGGHYIARGLRADGKVYQFDDHVDSLSAVGPTPNVYMVFYHVERLPSSGDAPDDEDPHGDEKEVVGSDPD